MAATEETADQDDGDLDDLADDLFEVSYNSTDGEDHPLGEVVAVERDDVGMLRVRVQLPSGRVIPEDMEFPEYDSEEFKFVRVCDQADLSIENVEMLVGSRVPIDMDDETIHAPREASDDVTWLSMLQQAIELPALAALAMIGGVGFPVLFPLGVAIKHDEPGHLVESYRSAAPVWFAGSFFWAIGASGVWELHNALTAPGAATEAIANGTTMDVSGVALTIFILFIAIWTIHRFPRRT